MRKRAPKRPKKKFLRALYVAVAILLFLVIATMFVVGRDVTALVGIYASYLGLAPYL
jgi:hypothetical protein